MATFKLMDEKNTYIDDTVEIGENTIIYPNVFLKGTTKIGSNCVIYPNSMIENSVILNNVVIESSKIVDTTVHSNTNIGPFAHLRNGCVVGEHVRIGNFVELKNVRFGNHSKCAHLTYLGDANVGEHVNIGCGVVTVNYDGVNKFKTVIEDHCFIGSNANLIAPVHIHEKALIAAGSTITHDVFAGEMAIARSHQTNKQQYGNQLFEKKMLKKGGKHE